MAYKQLVGFNTGKGGNKAGFCLQNVRLGFGIKSKYNTANDAWSHTKQHTDAIPTAVAIPLFYDFDTDGHVNVQLANGQVWSDGIFYNNLAHYLQQHPRCHYKGWGESLNEIAIVAYAQPVVAANGFPADGQTIHLNKGVTRTVFKPGTDTVTGTITAADDTYNYLVRSHRGYRVNINSAKFGGAVELALFDKAGNKFDGWHVL